MRLGKLKQMLKQATIGELFKNPSGIWTAHINLPDHCAAIQIHQSELLEAKTMRHIIMDALHTYGNIKDHETWREEYYKKQASGVKFEFNKGSKDLPRWLNEGPYEFLNDKEDYREMPQPIPHEAERKLWKAQREAGTNEQWQYRFEGYSDYFDIPVGQEPGWYPKSFYRVKLKPAKLTAKIIRKGKWPTNANVHDWKFYGTPDEYRAECEKYGYLVVSEIKEVTEPKTVMYYFCMVDSLVSFTSIKGESKEDFRDRLVRSRHTIIGNIEEREVEL